MTLHRKGNEGNLFFLLIEWNLWVWLIDCLINWTNEAQLNRFWIEFGTGVLMAPATERPMYHHGVIVRIDRTGRELLPAGQCGRSTATSPAVDRRTRRRTRILLGLGDEGPDHAYGRTSISRGVGRAEERGFGRGSGGDGGLVAGRRASGGRWDGQGGHGRGRSLVADVAVFLLFRHHILWDTLEEPGSGFFP